MNDLTEILNLHTRSCDTLLQLIAEENRYLKGARRVPEEHFLSRKRAALGTLSASLDALRQAAAQAGPAQVAPLREMLGRAQQTIMKTLLVDRENEQLLLGCTMRECALPAAPSLNAAQLQRMYQRF